MKCHYHLVCYFIYNGKSFYIIIVSQNPCWLTRNSISCRIRPVDYISLQINRSGNPVIITLSYRIQYRSSYTKTNRYYLNTIKIIYIILRPKIDDIIDSNHGIWNPTYTLDTVRFKGEIQWSADIITNGNAVRVKYRKLTSVCTIITDIAEIAHPGDLSKGI